MDLLAVIGIGTEGCSDRLAELIGKYFIFSLAEVLGCRDWTLGLKTFEWWIFSMRKQLTYLGLVGAGPLVRRLLHSNHLRETHANLNCPMHTCLQAFFFSCHELSVFTYSSLPLHLTFFPHSSFHSSLLPFLHSSFSFPVTLKKIEMDRCAALGRRIVSLGPVWAMYQVQG